MRTVLKVVGIAVGSYVVLALLVAAGLGVSSLVRSRAGAQQFDPLVYTRLEDLDRRVQALELAPADTEVEETTVPAEDNSDTGAVNSLEPVNWVLAELAKYFDPFEVSGVKWVLPLGTHFAVDTSGGRYEAVESGPVGVVGGKDYGWCAVGQLDCPPHLGLYRVEVTDGVSAIMDIATRVMVTGDDGGSARFQWRFNTETRTAAELMDDYTVAASQGQLGLFIAVADPLMDPATLTFLNKEYLVSYGCWDCLAHTSGVDNPIVSLDDESISQFGPDTPTFGDSLYPAYVIPVPSPKDDPDFAIDLMVEMPTGTDVVFWFGRYDVSDPPG